MRNMEAVGMAALSPQYLKRTQRLSTMRRIARLEVLLDEMKVRELTHYDVADFLMCSLSSARNYMHELLDAGLLSAIQHGQERRNRDETPLSGFGKYPGGGRIHCISNVQSGRARFNDGLQK
jgi:hypothetical protein